MTGSRKNQLVRLCFAAMLTALQVVLGTFFSLPVGPMRFTLDGLPIILAALLMGPWWGVSVGLVGRFFVDLFGTYGLSVTTPLWMLPAGLRALVVGLFFIGVPYGDPRRSSYTSPRLMAALPISSLVVTLANTAATYFDSKIFGYYAPGVVWAAFGWRLLAGVITAAVYFAVVPWLVRPLQKLMAA